MAKIFVPPGLLEELVCLTCKRLLSVFPIFTHIEGLGGICGRCNGVQDGFIRDEAYECLVKHLLFPCTFKGNGCPEFLSPEALKDHEVQCDFDKFHCVRSDCEWKGAREKLFSHFEENHPESVLKEPQFKLGDQQFKTVTLLKNNNEIFQVNLEYDPMKRIFQYLVEPIKNNLHIYSYDVKFQCEHQSYTGREHIMSADDKKMKSDDLSRFEEPQTIVVHIRIKQPMEEGNVDVSSDIKDNPNIDWQLLTELECPVCFDYMLPPIFQCVTGHSICDVCKPKLAICPSCKATLGQTRNFNLEKMTERITYPCKYYKLGCVFFGLSGDIKNHEITCSWGPLSCPMRAGGCIWYGNESDFNTHIDEKHPNHILKDNFMDVPFNPLNNSDATSLIKLLPKVFVLKYNYTANSRSFSWTIQMLGAKQVTGKYKYEIEVIDLSGSRRSLIWRGPVQMSGYEQQNNRAQFLCSLSHIENFIRNKITFRVRVFRD